MRTVFIVNPCSGKGRHTESLCSRIREAAAQCGQPLEIYITQSKGDGEQYVRALGASGEAARIFACGGDGTLNEVINGAYGYANLQVGVVPVGSGNDFIKSFTHPDAFNDLQAQLAGEEYALDLIRCNDRYGINLANIGFDCTVARRMAHFKTLPLVSGSGAYTLALILTFLQKMGQTLRVTFPDGQSEERSEILVAIGNGNCYGGGYFATPIAVLNDRLLDVSRVRQLSRLKILRLIGFYKKGEHLHHPGFAPYLQYRRTSALTIESDRPLELCIDGEILQQGNRIEFSVAEQSIRFLLPKGATPRNNATDADTPQPIPV